MRATIDGLDTRAVLREIVAVWDKTGKTRGELAWLAGTTDASLSRAVSDTSTSVPKADFVSRIGAAAGVKLIVEIRYDPR